MIYIDDDLPDGDEDEDIYGNAAVRLEPQRLRHPVIYTDLH
jgi:hypothetical protein